MATLAPCTCGAPPPRVVAHRLTLDGRPLLGWSDGSVTVLGWPSEPVAVRALALPGASPPRSIRRVLALAAGGAADGVCRRVLGPDRPGRNHVTAPRAVAPDLGSWTRRLGRVTDPTEPGAPDWAADDWTAEATDRALGLAIRCKRMRRRRVA